MTPPSASAVGAAMAGFGERLTPRSFWNEYLWPPGVLVSMAGCLLRAPSESHTICCVYHGVRANSFRLSDVPDGDDPWALPALLASRAAVIRVGVFRSRVCVAVMAPWMRGSSFLRVGVCSRTHSSGPPCGRLIRDGLNAFLGACTPGEEFALSV